MRRNGKTVIIQYKRILEIVYLKMKDNDNKDNLVSIDLLLKAGKENAIPRDKIARYYGMSMRELDNLVAQKRKEGIPILAKKYGGGGLYLPQEVGDIEEYSYTVLKEVRSRIEIFDAMNKCKEEWMPDRQQAFTFIQERHKKNSLTE